MRFNFIKSFEVNSKDFSKLSKGVWKLGLMLGVGLPALMFYMEYDENKVG